MAAPTFQAKGTAASGTGSSISPSYMGSISANDIIIMKVFSYGIGTITPHASWTPLNFVYLPFSPSPPTMVARWYGKIATGSESGSESVSRSGHSGAGLFFAQMYQFRGTANLTIEDHDSTGGLGSTITFNATTVNSTERTLAAFVINYNGSDPGVPTGYSSSATDSVSGSYFELNTKSNVSSDGSVTISGGSSNGWMTLHMSLYNNDPSSIVSRSFIVN